MNTLAKICFCLLLVSCSPQDDLELTPSRVLENLYDTTTDYYANFDGRPDLDSAYQAIANDINSVTDEEMLFDRCFELLFSLRDPHVTLSSPAKKALTQDYLKIEDNIDLDLIKRHYLVSALSERQRVAYGILPNNIGYLFIADFISWTKYGELPDEFHEAFKVIDSTDGLVIDLRENNGGSAILAQAVASVFHDHEFIWHYSINKRGSGEMDFDRPYVWKMKPSRHFNYKEPVVVLTSAKTISAGERFLLAMRKFNRGHIVGQVTGGSLGSVMGRELINGWTTTLTFEKVLDWNGQNYDYIGITPDHPITTTVSDFDAGRDPLLDYAIDYLN